MNRREARELLFTLVFEYGFKQEEDFSAVYASALENREFEEDAYVKSGFEGIVENVKVIDEKISAHSASWALSRISKVSLAIMRIAVYEMLFCDDIPVNVSINEALELAKRFDEEKSPKYVNGVLNAIASERGKND